MSDATLINKIAIWKDNIPPENSNQEDLNIINLVDEEISLSIIGFVMWDTKIQTYVFHFHLNESGSDLKVGGNFSYVIFEDQVYQSIKISLHQIFGISKMRGVYSENNPPELELPKNSFMIQETQRTLN